MQLATTVFWYIKYVFKEVITENYIFLDYSISEVIDCLSC